MGDNTHYTRGSNGRWDRDRYGPNGRWTQPNEYQFTPTQPLPNPTAAQALSGSMLPQYQYQGAYQAANYNEMLGGAAPQPFPALAATTQGVMGLGNRMSTLQLTAHPVRTVRDLIDNTVHPNTADEMVLLPVTGRSVLIRYDDNGREGEEVRVTIPEMTVRDLQRRLHDDPHRSLPKLFFMKRRYNGTWWKYPSEMEADDSYVIRNYLTWNAECKIIVREDGH